MNRTTIRIAVGAAIIVSWCAMIRAEMPQIKGTVFTDYNFNGSVDPGEAYEGARLRLYQDDGDGILEPGGDDPQFGPDQLSRVDGSYRFDGLIPEEYFFVERLPTAGNGLDYSGLIDPTEPSIVIDAFSTQESVVASPTVPQSSSSLTLPSGEAIGDERDLLVQWDSGLGEAKLRVNPFGGDLLQYDTTSGVNGIAVVTWDGKDGSASQVPAMGLGGLDLTEDGLNESIMLKFGIDLTGLGEHATVRIFSGDASNYSEAQIELPVTDGSASAYSIMPFDDFLGPVQASEVDAIQLILGDGARSVDAQIDLVGVVGGKQTHDFALIPEPSTALLALLGMAGMFVHVRRQRR